MTRLPLRVAGVVQARREVSELVSSMVEAGGALPLPEDRLLTIMEAAQVLPCHSPVPVAVTDTVTCVVPRQVPHLLENKTLSTGFC